MQAAPVGVMPAIPRPFTDDGREVDVEALRRVVRHVVDGGVHGIMTTGGTGEFPHLSRDERRLVTEVVVSEAAGGVTIFAGTSACATREAIELTRDAAAAGADAAILVPRSTSGSPTTCSTGSSRTSPEQTSSRSSSTTIRCTPATASRPR